MEEAISEADREVLVETVKFTQKYGCKGSRGGWKDFLGHHDKDDDAAGFFDPAKRSTDTLVAFLNTFTKKEWKSFEKFIRRRSDHLAIERFVKEFPDLETPEQRLVRLTTEHPQYTQRFSFPYHYQDWVVVPLGKVYKAMNSKKLIAVDCEMVLCEDGTDAVVRICAVDQNLEVKLDKFVNPKKTVVDYRTDITGITAKDLEGVTCSLEEVQKSLKKLVSHGTILVGHSLHNDLKVLKIEHPRVIDTSCIFRFMNLPTTYAPSLNNLCESVLGYKIRREGEPHNCLTDAQAAMKLALAKLEHGFNDPIAIAGKEVPSSDLRKLLLHNIPVELPCQNLRTIFPMDYDYDIQTDLRVKGQCYSTYAIFKTEGEADAAFRRLEGQETTDSIGRLQKNVSVSLSTGQTVNFYVRKMKADGLVNGIESLKRRYTLEEGNRDLKRQKGGLHRCDHAKEIERLKQELHDREEEIFNLQRTIASFTAKQGH